MGDGVNVNTDALSNKRLELRIIDGGPVGENTHRSTIVNLFQAVEYRLEMGRILCRVAHVVDRQDDDGLYALLADPHRVDHAFTPRTVQPAALAASLSAPPRGSRLAAAAPPSHVRRLLETSLHVAARRLAAASNNSNLRVHLIFAHFSMFSTLPKLERRH